MDRIELVRALYVAYRNGDTEYGDKVFADDVEVLETEELPWGGRYRGKDEFATFSQRVQASLAEPTIEPGQFFEAGDTVVQIGRSKGIVKATGRAFDVAVVHLLTVHDDKIVRFDSYVDTRAIRAALSS